jgi:hypothetical protein
VPPSCAGAAYRFSLSRSCCNTANVLVQQYGHEDALLMAAKRCDALLEPLALVRRVNDDGHPIIDRNANIVRRRGYDRGGPRELAACRIPPSLP